MNESPRLKWHNCGNKYKTAVRTAGIHSSGWSIFRVCQSRGGRAVLEAYMENTHVLAYFPLWPPEKNKKSHAVDLTNENTVSFSKDLEWGPGWALGLSPDERTLGAAPAGWWASPWLRALGRHRMVALRTLLLARTCLYLTDFYY